MADYGPFSDIFGGTKAAAPATALPQTPQDYGLFDDIFNPPPRGNIAEAGRALARGVVGGAGQAASGVSALLPESAPDLGVGRAGKAVTGYARERFAPSPGREGEFFANELPEAVGGMAPGAAAVIGGSVAGTPLTGLGVGAALFGAQGAGSAAEEAEAKGASPGQRQAAAAGGALSGAALSLIPGGTLTRLMRLPGTALPGILGYGMRTAAAGGEGASIGAIGRGIDNAIAQYTYDPDRTLSEGMAHAATLTGATAGLLHGLVGELGRRRPEAPTPEPEAPKPGQLALPAPAIPMGDGAPPAAGPPLGLPEPRWMQRGTAEAGEPGGIEHNGPTAMGPNGEFVMSAPGQSGLGQRTAQSFSGERTTYGADLRNQSDPLALVAKYESKNQPLIGWGNTDLSGYKLTDTGFPDWPGKPGPKGNSTAAGLYQITRSTWEPIARRLGIHDFSPESQRAVAEELYRTRGLQPWAPHNPELAAALARGEAGELPARSAAGGEGAPLALPAPLLALPKPETTYGADFLMSDTKKPAEEPKPVTAQSSPLDRALNAVSQLNPGDPVTRRLLAQLSGLRSADQIATLRDRMVKQGVVSSRDGRYYRAETANKPEAFSRPAPTPETPPVIPSRPPEIPHVAPDIIPGPTVEARAPQPAPENLSTNPVPFQERPAPAAAPSVDRQAREWYGSTFMGGQRPNDGALREKIYEWSPELQTARREASEARLAQREAENPELPGNGIAPPELTRAVRTAEQRERDLYGNLRQEAVRAIDEAGALSSERRTGASGEEAQRQAELKELPLGPTEPVERPAPQTPLEIALENRRQREISLGRDPDKFLPRDTAPRGKKGDLLRNQDQPNVLGYDLDRETLTPTRKRIDLQTPGDYGADPIGDGKFRMVPSGDIVDLAERNSRLSRFHQRPGLGTEPRAALRDELYSLVRERAPTLRLRTLDELVGTIEGRASPIHGAYHTETRPGGLLEHIASVALGGPDPRAALSHEIVHFFRRSGMFTRPEWEILSGKADKWAEQFKISERYKDQPIGVRREEAVAEAYAAWDRGDMQMPPGLRRIFGKVKDFFDRTGNWLRGQGFQSADDVFRSMDRGDVGGRAEQGMATPEAMHQRPASVATEEQRRDLDRIMARDDRTLADRAKGTINGLRENAAVRFKQSMLDDLAGLSNALQQKAGAAWDAAKSMPLLMARLLRNHETRMATVIGVPEAGGTFKGGALRYDPQTGAFKTIEGSKPFAEFAKPIFDAGKQDLLALWMIARRAGRLMAEGREHNVSAADIAKYEHLDREHPEFREFAREWRTLNKHTLDLAEATGLINKEQRALFEHDDYAPFYRETIDGLIDGPRGAGGQHIRSGIKALKGGEARVGNLFENMVQNLSSLIERGAANATRRAIYKEFSGTEMLKEKSGWQPPNGKPDPAVFSFMDNGKARYFDVQDPMLLRSLVAMGPHETSGIMKVLGFPKKVLTGAITSDPAFMVANLLRDSLHTAVVVGGVNPMSTAKGFVDALRNSPSAMALMAGGASGGHFYNTAPASVRAMLESQGFKDSVLSSPNKIWKALQKVGSASEQANRIAVYENALKNGATELEALGRAQDLLNFTMRGDSKAMQFLIETVPFLNARMQGLYRLGRGAVETPKSFLLRGSMIMAASAALWAANHDDERYKALEDWDKQSYFHFFVGDSHFRLPSPFEVGAIYHALPNMLLDYADNGRTKQLGNAFVHMVVDQLNFDPVPQIIKPAAELYANKDSFTGRPIVNDAEKRLTPELQYGPNASPTIVALAGSLGASPDQAEHLLRGYTGTLGTYALAAADALAETVGATTPRAEKRLDQIPMIQRFVRQEPALATRWLSEFYDLKNSVDQLTASAAKYRQEGDAAGLKSLMTPENASLMALHSASNAAGQQLAMIRRSMAQIQADKTMDPADKRTRLDALMAARNQVASSAARPLIQRAEGLTAQP